jgi:hypothetical protein
MASKGKTKEDSKCQVGQPESSNNQSAPNVIFHSLERMLELWHITPVVEYVDLNLHHSEANQVRDNH